MLKKIMLSLCCVGILSLMNICGQSLLFENGDYYIFYGGNESSSAHMVSAEGINALKVKATIKHLSGESATYLNQNLKEKIIQDFNAEIMFTETIANIKNYYAYTEKIENYIVLNGIKINLHIAVSQDKTTVGSPIIFGGY
jgi:hypothetical protein